jgi:hypothetical protein
LIIPCLAAATPRILHRTGHSLIIRFMEKTCLLAFIAIMVLASCVSTDRITPGEASFESLVRESERYFKTDRSNIDIHPFWEEPGKQGVFRVFNKAAKGDGVLFIVTVEGVIAPDSPGYGFHAAAGACRVLHKLPQSAGKTAELYLGLSGLSHRNEILIEDPLSLHGSPMTGLISMPAAAALGTGFQLDFWTRDINTDSLIRYRVDIDGDGNAALAAREVITR